MKSSTWVPQEGGRSACKEGFVGADRERNGGHLTATLISDRNLAFIHTLKTAGTFFVFYLMEILRDYEFRDSWNFESLDRDWNRHELYHFLNKYDARTFVHNHSFGWDQEIVAMYNRAGWETVTLVREPGEVLCSLYFFLMKYQRMLGRGKTIDQELSLDEFVRGQLLDRVYDNNISYLKWEIPPYWRSIKHIYASTPHGIKRLLWSCLRHEYSEKIAKTVRIKLKQTTRSVLIKSKNRGYAFYLKHGDISDTTDSLRIASPYYSRYKEVLSHIQA